ncbi:serine protease HTRA2, mitochondrial-like [Glandiceps talaboti]
MASSCFGNFFQLGRNYHRNVIIFARFTQPQAFTPHSHIIVRTITKQQQYKNVKIYWKTIGQFVLACSIGYFSVEPLTKWFTLSRESRRERKGHEMRAAEKARGKNRHSVDPNAVSESNIDTWRGTSILSLVPSVKAAQISHDKPVPSVQPLRSKRFNFIADTVENSLPALVYIEIHDRHPFFGRDIPTANGSGFIISPDGLILTNAHVVANRKSVKVKLHDGRVLDGKVTAIDPVSDIATIKVEAQGQLPAMRLGTSSELRPGEWVIAMGSPLSLSNTITSGIVSTVHRGSRELGLRNKDMNYIQTDASINFGNSGGPLVNLDGEAIGINTMKVTAGISFAIPIDYAKDFLMKVEKLELEKAQQSKGWFGSSGKDSTKQISISSKRHYIGLTMLTLTPSIIWELQQKMQNFPDVQSGVLVHSVMMNSPSYSAGVRPGDVIININGQDVKTATDVYDAVNNKKVLEMILIRQNKKIKVEVIPEEAE